MSGPEGHSAESAKRLLDATFGDHSQIDRLRAGWLERYGEESLAAELKALS